MKKFIISLFFLLCIPLYAETYVAVVETVAENDAIGRYECNFLTDKLRERAKMVLPSHLGFEIITRENIDTFIDSKKNKAFADYEASSLVEIGKKIGANYISQAYVRKFANQLSLTVELYDTETNNLVGSFTAMNNDGKALLAEIERNADEMFALIKDRNIHKTENSPVVNNNEVVIRVTSNPVGAVFSIDGRPSVSCSNTPCEMNLKPGSHRFSFGADMFYDKDTILDVEYGTETLYVELDPNFGELTLNPQLVKGIGVYRDLEISLDDEMITPGIYPLRPGSYKVQMNHPCYENVSFKATLKDGSRISFDRMLIPALGGIDLVAESNGRPKALPVYVNDEYRGMTPFLETVPVCGKLTIGEEAKPVPVTIIRNKTIAYTYEFYEENSQEDGDYPVVGTQNRDDYRGFSSDIEMEKNDRNWLQLGGFAVLTVSGVTLALIDSDGISSGSVMGVAGVIMAIIGSVGLLISF